MSLFAISDLHLSFGCDKPMDVFGPRWAGYTERLRDNWQKIITEDDTVVINGDFSWGMTLEETLFDFKFLDSLNGKKLISKGNHDYWWSTSSKITQFFEKNDIKTVSLLHNNAYLCGDVTIAGARGWMLEVGCEHDKKIINREAMRLRLSLNEAKKLDSEKETIVFLHYPPKHNNVTCEPIVDVLKTYGVKQVYFGHLHGISPSFVTAEVDGIRTKLVSSDFLSFVPLLVSKYT